MSNETVAAARREFMATLDDKGTATCPCCDHTSTVWLRRVSKGQVALMKAMQNSADSWVQLGGAQPMKFRCGDYSVLRFWGLIEEAPDNAEVGQPEKSSAGYWRVTTHGIAFLMGFAGITKYVHVLDNDAIGFSGPTVYVHDVDKNFHFFEHLEAATNAG